MGHWVIDVAKPLTAQIEAISHPIVATGNETVVTLKVGETTLQQGTKAGWIRFDGVKLPMAERRLEAIRHEGGEESGANQLIVTTSTVSVRS